MSDDIVIHLKARHFDYLRSIQACFPDSLLRVLETVQEKTQDTYVLSTSREIAEEFRDAFTDRLARYGFDAQYELTEEGKLLEDLIDRFFPHQTGGFRL